MVGLSRNNSTGFLGIKKYLKHGSFGRRRKRSPTLQPIFRSQVLQKYRCWLSFQLHFAPNTYYCTFYILDRGSIVNIGVRDIGHFHLFQSSEFPDELMKQGSNCNFFLGARVHFFTQTCRAPWFSFLLSRSLWWVLELRITLVSILAVWAAWVAELSTSGTSPSVPDLSFPLSDPKTS